MEHQEQFWKKDLWSYSQDLCVGDRCREKFSKIGLETMSALIRVSDPKDLSGGFREGQKGISQVLGVG